jgi:putative oxidoreductase
MCLTAKNLGRFQFIGLLALRIALAAVFFYHGYQKFGLWSAAPENMPANMVLLFRALAVIETVAAVGVLLGLFTRYFALALGIVMVGAIYFKMGLMGVGFSSVTGAGWEFDLVNLAGTLVLLFSGAGSISIDHKLGKE